MHCCFSLRVCLYWLEVKDAWRLRPNDRNAARGQRTQPMKYAVACGIRFTVVYVADRTGN
jgi:hypothetical protein